MRTTLRNLLYLITYLRGRFAYTVAIERASVPYAGQTERQEQVLRTTVIFRFEKGAWKIVHRQRTRWSTCSSNT